MRTKLGTATPDKPTPVQAARLKFIAPSATAITSVQIARSLGKDEQAYRLFARLGDGSALAGETCDLASGDLECEVGGAGTPYEDFSGLSTPSVEWGFECLATPTTCATGATLHAAWLSIYGSVVTIDDPTFPTLTNVGGNLFSGAWQRATVDATADAADSTGIKELRWYADGALVSDGTTTRTCDYSRSTPCTNPTAGSSVPLDTSLLADGTHSVQLAVVDAAGNETMSAPQAVQVDNTAPVAPTGITAPQSKTTNSFDVAWTNPGGELSPLAARRYRLCQGATCGEVQTVSGTTATLTGLSVPTAGTWTLKVWLEDQAGNQSEGSAASTTLTYNAPSSGGGGGGGGGGSSSGTATTATTTTSATPAATPVQPTETVGAQAPSTAPPLLQPVTPTVRAAALRLTAAVLDRARRTVTVSGTLTRGAPGRVTLRVEAVVKGRLRRVSRTTVPVRGAFTARVILPSTLAGARRPRVLATYAGSERWTAASAALTAAKRAPARGR